MISWLRRIWHWITALPESRAVSAAASVRDREPRICIGKALRSDGSWMPVGPSLRDLRQILHLTAGMGAGKSRLLANICQQLLTLQSGFILADGKGDDDQGSLAATVRRLVPLDEEQRLVILDVLDTEWPIGFNPFAGIDLRRPGGVDIALGQILAIFGRLDPETWATAPTMQNFVRMGALLVLEAEPAPTMAHIKQALIDEGYRTDLLRRCTNLEVRHFWTAIYPEAGDQQQTSLHALLRRFDNLLTIETTRYLLTQPFAPFDFKRAMDERLIVLLPMPDMTLGGLAGLVGMLALQAIVRAAFQRTGSDQTRHTYPLIVDEFQVFLNAGSVADIETAMTRLRSLGIGGIYAHQTLKQLGELADIMLINAQLRLMLKTSDPDAATYARLYAASGLAATDIANQDPNEHQYAVLQCHGQPTGPISIQPLPWPLPTAPLVPNAPADWQTRLPANAEAADGLICRLVYGSYGTRHMMRLVGGLASLDADAWSYLQTRWTAIAAHQRQHILAYPGCIAPPEPVPTEEAAGALSIESEQQRRTQQQLTRQRWLSRLWVAQPRVLVAAAYQRQRWTVQPSEKPAPVRGSRGRRHESNAETAGVEELWSVSSEVARSEPSSTPREPQRLDF